MSVEADYVLQNYHTKAALIILHSRVDLPQVYNKGSNTPRVNRWVRVTLFCALTAALSMHLLVRAL